jgi:ZIP family zinc transporter
MKQDWRTVFAIPIPSWKKNWIFSAWPGPDLEAQTDGYESLEKIEMIYAALWSAIATGTLLIGMALAYRNAVSQRWTGLIMAFGVGAIISATAYQLVLGPLYEVKGSYYLVAVGLFAGALTFYFADKWVDNMGGAERMDFDGWQAGGSGTGILLGSLLDGVPESLVLGLSLVHSPQVSLAFVFAVAIGNIPQGLGGTTGMLSGGWQRSKITRLWLAVCGLSILAAVLGYGLATLLPDASGAVIDAFAAGALLVMLCDSMIPEAFEHGSNESGLLLVCGFAISVALSLAQLGAWNKWLTCLSPAKKVCMEPVKKAEAVEKDIRTIHPVQKFLLLDVMRDKSSRPIFYWTIAVLVIGTVVFHWLEGWSYLDSFYFCVISLATIGYGDLTPTTPVAKIFTIVYVINGIAILLALIDRVRVVRTQWSSNPIEAEKETWWINGRCYLCPDEYSFLVPLDKQQTAVYYIVRRNITANVIAWR